MLLSVKIFKIRGRRKLEKRFLEPKGLEYGPSGYNTATRSSDLGSVSTEAEKSMKISIKNIQKRGLKKP